MSDAPTPRAQSVPKHLWIIGVIALLWNLMGAYDYLMTKTRNEAYMSQFEPAQLEIYYNFPVWLTAFWALAVWGGVLGCVLLLLRKALAVPVFMVSLASMVITTGYNLGFSGATEFMGAVDYIFALAIFVVALGLVFYSRNLRARGILA